MLLVVHNGVLLRPKMGYKVRSPKVYQVNPRPSLGEVKSMSVGNCLIGETLMSEKKGFAAIYCLFMRRIVYVRT